MRISFLSQQVAATSEELESFSIFQQLAEATSHIPILEDWIALERTEKRRVNMERENIEVGFKEFIRSSATEFICKDDVVDKREMLKRGSEASSKAWTHL